MTSSRRIAVGLCAGVLTGLVFGDLVAPLKVVADGFVKLLQMTVLPYVTISVVSSLGGLARGQAKALGIRGGAVLLGLWMIAFSLTLLAPLALPPLERGTFFSTTLIEPRPPFDVVALYIASNPFNALANNVVPAVVLFSVILGVALIGVERKASLLDVLQTATAVIGRATSLIVKLTPYGLFAIAAVAAGTLTLEQLQRIEVYFVTYIAIALIMALWILPGLVAALTGIPVRQLFRRTRDPLIVAFVAGDLFIVLPSLIDACKVLLEEHRAAHPADAGRPMDELRAGPDVIVPVSFNFPHCGKLLSLTFIPFAAWFAGAPLAARDYPQLLGAGLLSFFGSLNSAVPFLLDAFHLPADTFQLFLATGVINSRFGTLVAAMHTVTLGVLGSLALTGDVQWRLRRIVRFGLVTAAIAVTTVTGVRVLFGTVLRQDVDGADVLYSMQPLLGGPPARLGTTAPPDTRDAAGDEGVLDAIRSRGVLRVVVLPDRMPFAFANRQGQLVGMDVELAQALAGDLGVGVEFFQAEYGGLSDLLTRGRCDIAMSGVTITAERARSLLFSAPYLDETLAFVTRDHLRERFRSWDAIRELGAVRVGVPDLPSYRRAIRARAPQLEMVPLRSTDALFRDADDLMAYALPAERGSVLTLLHPAYSVVVPSPDTIKLPVAYPVGRGDERWASYINTWLELKRRDGTIDALYRHWILGQHAVPPTHRWSVVRNLLGWTD